MDWLEEVQQKAKRKNQILFSKDCPLFDQLNLLLEQQNHRAVVLWALELAEEAVICLKERYPDDFRPEDALNVTRLWAAGKVKMPVAKKEILRCHGMAKELSSPEDIALCHAIGQACGTVHTVGHALGFPIYELTAIVRRMGLENCRNAVEERCRYYVQRLVYWQQQEPSVTQEWAKFLAK